MNNAKLTYDDIQKSIKSIVNECYDISENKFPILKSIKKIEIDNYKSFDELRIAMFNHALKYDCELQETFLLKLNELFSNSDFKFESLSDEARKKCKSSKWGNKKSDNYKFTPYFISDCKINTFIQKKAYEDFNIIYRNINKVILNIYSYCVISDFTTFFILVYKYKIDPININIAVDSEFEKWLYELFGAKSENIDLIVNWDGEMKELKYKGPIAEIKDDNGNKKLIPAKYVNKPKKYDVVFGNPPYTRNLDLSILEALLKISKSVIFIHPSAYLLSPKYYSPYNKIKDKFGRFLNSVKLFWGNEIFNISMFLPLCITEWDTNKHDDQIIINDFVYEKGIYKIKDINNITHYGSSINFILPFKEKIIKYIEKNGSLYSHRVKRDYSNITNFSFIFPAIRGDKIAFHSFFKNSYSSEFEIVNSTFRYEKDVAYSRYLLWSFKNENERKIFINFCKTKIARFCLSFIKNGSHLDTSEVSLVPWLDFTQEWDDAKLCKEFEISDELWNYIDNFIPDYYDDYKSGFEK